MMPSTSGKNRSPKYYTFCLKTYIRGSPMRKITHKNCLKYLLQEKFNRLSAYVLTRLKGKGMLAATHDKQGGRGRCILPD